MPNFAVIHNGQVTNVIVADDKETAESITMSNCVRYMYNQDVRIGMFYNEADSTFSETYPAVD